MIANYLSNICVILICLFIINKASFACSLINTVPVRLDAVKAILLQGKVCDVRCQSCDTIIDTIDIGLGKFEPTDTSQEIAIKRQQLNKHANLKMIKDNNQLILYEDDSTIIRKYAHCQPCELVIIPSVAFSSPNNIDTLFVPMYGLLPDCSTYPIRSIRIADFIDSHVIVSGKYYTHMSKAFVEVTPYNIISFVIKSGSIEINQKVNYRDEMASNYRHINGQLELAKSLIMLNRHKGKKERMIIINNLMYSRFSVDDPTYFAKMVKANMPDLNEFEIMRLLKKQSKIADKWNLFSNKR